MLDPTTAILGRALPHVCPSLLELVPPIPIPVLTPGSNAGPNTEGAELPTASLTWLTSNPGGGGSFGGAAIGPEGLLVVVSDLSGAYISRDDGRSWSGVGAAQGLLATHTSSVALDSSDPDRVYVGTDEGVFVSEDGGQQFEVAIESGYATALVVGGSASSGNQSNVVYAAVSARFDSSDTEIWRSTGNEFVRVESDLPDGRVVLALRIDLNDSDRLLAIVGEGRFASGPQEAWRSVDGGITWRQIGADLGPAFDAQFASTPADPGRVLLTTRVPNESGQGNDSNGALHASGDGGETWQQLHDATGVIWASASDGVLIRLVDVEHQFPWDDRQGVWESGDGGQTWDRVGSVEDWNKGWSTAYWAFGAPFDGLVKTLTFDANDPDRAIWVNGQFVYQSRDGGVVFEPLFTDEVSDGAWRSRGVDNVVIAEVEISEADPDLWLVGYWDLGCFRSLDQGSSWENCNDPDLSGTWEGAGGFMPTVLTDPARSGVVWAALAQDWEEPATLVRSTESGRGDSWERSAESIGTDVFGLSLDPTSEQTNRTLFVTIEGDVFRSSDDGMSWHLVLDCGGCRETAVTTSGTVFAGGEAGLWRSTEGGAEGSWDEVGVDAMRGSVSDPPWSFGWSGVTSIVVSHQDEGSGDELLVTVYTGDKGDGGDGEDGGLYRSADNGDSWELMRPNAYARAVVVDQDSGQIWLGSSSAFDAGGFDPQSVGLEKSKDGGKTWTVVEAGLPFPLVSHLALAGDRLFVGSPGVGLTIGQP